jgi:hypothetical protein
MTTAPAAVRFRGENGQTAVEVSVVLGTIRAGILAAFAAVSGASATAIQAETDVFG